MPLIDIRAIGLEKYLDSTIGKHRKKGYKELVEMIQYRASSRYMARAFNVNRNTMTKWIKIYQEEQKPAKT